MLYAKTWLSASVLAFGLLASAPGVNASELYFTISNYAQSQYYGHDDGYRYRHHYAPPRHQHHHRHTRHCDHRPPPRAYYRHHQPQAQYYYDWEPVRYYRQPPARIEYNYRHRH